MYDGATVQFPEKFALCWICNCLTVYPVTFSHPLFVTARLILVADSAHSVKYTDLVHDIIDDKTPKWSVQRISAGL